MSRSKQLDKAALSPDISRDLLGKVIDEVFDGAIEDATVIEDIYRVITREHCKQAVQMAAPDLTLRARVADLLHLLQHAKISCPSAGDAAQALVVLGRIRMMLASQPDQPAQQPVAYQKRIGFHGEWMDWEPCTKECFDHFAANPADFWQTRALYAAAPAPAEQQSAWVEQVMDQAQVFASAWALVGGPFDTGNGLEQAEEEKERLRALLGGKA